MFSIFNSPRKYPIFYEVYSDKFNFYDGREKWLDSIADLPTKAVHLYSIHWCHLEIYNGGFWQYFYNSTSTSMPEAIEGFKAIGMQNVADIVDKASHKIDRPFPFDKEIRENIVGDVNNPMDFDEFDNQFYELADTDKFFRKLPKFVPFADRYAGF